ncbi:fibronectin type III domain-containing protein [Clostridium aceticum]|uniref:Fibronectin type III domain-containing protein n=1 Tax=Clostridium aceticum TaxID=84022 RepID=A0A0D8I9H6_9CLOT|nr:fibronectin type III domain-containing protein [Clostridium aceticum]AKL96346.1 fibronectin type III domain-containing protein [Clostridium aceticum]KJF26935.1 hypothetical protein TZ02_10390 [Clostridium aceticum]
MKRLSFLFIMMFIISTIFTIFVLDSQVFAEIISNPPPILNASTISSTGIKLNWTYKSSNETGFKIERKVSGGNYSQIDRVDANTKSYTDTGLTADTTYIYRIRAYNDTEDSVYSNEVTETTEGRPAAPTNLTITSSTNTSVNLAWTDKSNNETGFKIERKVSGGSYVQIDMVGANKTTYKDTDIDSGERYAYRIRAYNSAGNSDYSNEATVTTEGKPAAPTNLTVISSTGNSVTLSWKDQSRNETGFKIERKVSGENYKEINSVRTNTTTYEDKTISSGNKYTYRVRAYNAVGESDYSNEVVVIPGSTPGPPTDLQVISFSGNSVTLSWRDQSRSETGFKIERKVPGGSYTQINTVDANVTTYKDTGLVSGKTYIYRVRAYNSAGNSYFTNEVTVISGNIPDAPTNLTVTIASATEVNLTWMDKSDNETGFVIERKTLGDSFNEIATVGTNVTNYKNSGLAANTTYIYRIKAYGSGGSSSYSNEVSITLSDEMVAKSLSKTQGIEMNFLVGQTVYYSNNQLKIMDTAPIVIESRTLLPIKYIVEAMDATVAWNDKEKKATIYFKEKTIELWMNNNTAKVNGVSTLIDPSNTNVKPITLPPGRIMLPLRFVTENMGALVNWNPKSQEIIIIYPAE